jgi:hypothetical protein
MNPATAARLFYTGGRTGQPGLLDIPGWTRMPLTVAAQAVQNSAHPDRYAQWEDESTRLLELRGHRAGLRRGELARREHDVYLARPAGHRNDAWEADHVEAPLEVDVDGRLVKPWVTWLVDAATNAVAGTGRAPEGANSGCGLPPRPRVRRAREQHLPVAADEIGSPTVPTKKPGHRHGPRSRRRPERRHPHFVGILSGVQHPAARPGRGSRQGKRSDERLPADDVVTRDSGTRGAGPRGAAGRRAATVRASRRRRD